MTGEQGTLNWEQGTGEEVTGATPRGQVTGEEGRGKREEGRGKREEVLGNFTFRYLCRFFPFTYLVRKKVQ